MSEYGEGFAKVKVMARHWQFNSDYQAIGNCQGRQQRVKRGWRFKGNAPRIRGGRCRDVAIHLKRYSTVNRLECDQRVLSFINYEIIRQAEGSVYRPETECGWRTGCVCGLTAHYSRAKPNLASVKNVSASEPGAIGVPQHIAG